DTTSAIHPTPGLAMVGLYQGDLPKLNPTLPVAGLQIALLGELGAHLGGSLYLYNWHGLERGLPPQVDYPSELALHAALRALVGCGDVPYLHDLSDGGFAVALAEACLGGVGANVTLPESLERKDALLFGESHGRAIIAFEPAKLSEVQALIGQVPMTLLGMSGGDRVVVDGLLDLPISELDQAWRNTLPEIFS
ncbi:MAG: phosphoribosylformylglycinamidine (FGAM) synthase-like enzyme, partial [Cognaticolwellia sp.]